MGGWEGIKGMVGKRIEKKTAMQTILLAKKKKS